jgi:hypothetical protein
MEGLDLRQQPKGIAEKQVLTWWLSRRTTVRRRWVSEELGIGDEPRVTQAIRRVKEGANSTATVAYRLVLSETQKSR